MREKKTWFIRIEEDLKKYGLENAKEGDIYAWQVLERDDNMVKLGFVPLKENLKQNNK